MKRYRVFALVALLFTSLFLVACAAEEEEGPVQAPGESLQDEEFVEEEQPVGVEDEEFFEEGSEVPDKIPGEEEDEVLEEGQLDAVPVEEDREDVPLAELAEIAADPSVFANNTILVEDEVGEVLDPYGFTLGDEGIPIVSTDPTGFPEGAVTTGSRVRLTGEVGTFDIGAFEEEFGVRMAEEIYERYEGGPYIQVRPEVFETVD